MTYDEWKLATPPEYEEPTDAELADEMVAMTAPRCEWTSFCGKTAVGVRPEAPPRDPATKIPVCEDHLRCGREPPGKTFEEEEHDALQRENDEQAIRASLGGLRL
jgi:hypothetical protein